MIPACYSVTLDEGCFNKFSGLHTPQLSSATFGFRTYTKHVQRQSDLMMTFNALHSHVMQQHITRLSANTSPRTVEEAA